jgi:isoleucyl-tRNA synthetase
LHPLHRILDPEHPLPIPRSLYQDVEPDIPYLLDANTAVKYAQEHARRHRLIGSSLQSSVILSFPDAESEAPFRKYKDELADILVASSVEIGVMLRVEDRLASWKFDVALNTNEDGGEAGVAVAWVLPPTGKKCPRCWRYVAPANDKLCKRCEDVLEDSGIDPHHV